MPVPLWRLSIVSSMLKSDPALKRTFSDGELLPLSVAESFDDLYGKALLCTAYVFAVVGVDAISSLMSAAILLW